MGIFAEKSTNLSRLLASGDDDSAFTCYQLRRIKLIPVASINHLITQLTMDADDKM